jgi:copper(I)-binding protein
MNTKKSLTIVSAIALVTSMLGLVACGDDSASDVVDEQSTLEITGAWSRTTPMKVTRGAVFMTITSPIDDELVAANVDASIAGSAEIHETQMTGAGEMAMHEVESISLPAGEAVALEPGGYHVMLMDLVAPLETGQEFDLVLTLAEAGDVTVEVVVADEAP